MVVWRHVDSRLHSDDHAWPQLLVAVHLHRIVSVQPQVVAQVVWEQAVQHLEGGREVRGTEVERGEKERVAIILISVPLYILSISLILELTMSTCSVTGSYVREINA